MIKNIIFDWSGTLSDDLTQVYQATSLVFDELGAKPISIEEYRSEFTLPYMNFWNKYFPNLTKEKCDKLFSTAFCQVGEPKPYLCVKDTLQGLSSHGIKMIVLSAHIQDKLVSEAKSYGLFDKFQNIYGDVHDKVEGIAEILKINEFKPSETMYVGDMTHDIEAGKEAGVKTVALTWGYQSKEILEKHNPDYIISQISELDQLLK